MNGEPAEAIGSEIRPVTLPPSGRGLEKIRDLLTRAPVFEDSRWEDIKIEPLDSFTNLSYKLTAHGSAYVLRVAGKGTSAYIDRGAEEHNARIASSVGLNAEVLFFDERDGTMLSRFIEGPHMEGIEFHRDPSAVARAALTLRRLHGIGRAFRSRFGAYAPIDYYLGLLGQMEAPLPDVFDEVRKEAEVVRRALEAAPVPGAPCHNDTCPENFVEVGRRIYLIDWEYSGMNDPMWDLANLSVEAGFSPVEDRKMMEAYCGGAVPPAFYHRVAAQKTVCDYFWGIWSVVQHANGNPAADFWAYATDRFEHCKALIGSEGFGRHLDALGAGHGR